MNQVNTLLARLESSTLPEHRRRAVIDLRALCKASAPQGLVFLDEHAVGLLVDVISMEKRQEANVELVRHCVDILLTVCLGNSSEEEKKEYKNLQHHQGRSRDSAASETASSSSSLYSSYSSSSSSNGHMNSGASTALASGSAAFEYPSTMSILISRSQHITTLLDVLPNNDLYLRYYAIQLITMLLLHKEVSGVRCVSYLRCHMLRTHVWICVSLSDVCVYKMLCPVCTNVC